VSGQNVELLRHWIEVFNARDIEALIALCDPDIEARTRKIRLVSALRKRRGLVHRLARPRWYAASMAGISRLRIGDRGGGARSQALAAALTGALLILAPARAAGAVPCSSAVRLGPAGPSVHLSRRGVPLEQPAQLMAGDVVVVDGSARFLISFPDRSSYSMHRGRATLVCAALALAPGQPAKRVLVLRLQSGLASATAGSGPAAAESPNGLAMAHHGGSRFSIRYRHGATSVRPSRPMAPMELIDVHHQRQLRIRVRPTQTGLIDRHGPRLETWPFALTPGQRRARPSDGLVPFEADGAPCSTGCRARARPGWPLRPFHRQHPLRSGLNEIRPSGLHLGFDVQAKDHELVYAMQSGTARIIKTGGLDKGVVQVGQFVYWHLDLSVRGGQWVHAYGTPLGRIHSGFGHVHLSETVGGGLLNVLRPGGRTLEPWSDTEAPIIGHPKIHRDGRVTVEAFDPQSFVAKVEYDTPVLAPAALAYRLFDAHDHRIGDFHWVFRSTRHLANGLRRVIFAPGARKPGFLCFALKRICKPKWRYRLAGGLAPPLPLGSLAPGRHRLVIYAYDYAGNVTARDIWFDRSAFIRSKRASSKAPVSVASPST